MKRLTKKELRALLEFIKECYPISDLETFRQRVVSRLSVETSISNEIAVTRFKQWVISDNESIAVRAKSVKRRRWLAAVCCLWGIK
jgi:hypothetical protein